MALMDAAPEPVRAAKIMFATTQTQPMPPRIQDTSSPQKLTILSESFASAMMPPARINRGQAISDHELMPLTAICTMVKSGVLLPKYTASRPENPIAKATGTPITINMRRKITAIFIIFSYPPSRSFPR